MNQNPIEEALSAVATAEELHRRDASDESASTLAIAQAKLGQQLVGAERFHEALAALKAASETFEALGDKRRQSGAMNGLGYCMLRLNQFDPASLAYGQAYRLGKEADDLHAQANALFGFGAAREAVARVNLDKARELWTEALRLYEAIDNARGAAQCREALGVEASPANGTSAASEPS